MYGSAGSADSLQAIGAWCFFWTLGGHYTVTSHLFPVAGLLSILDRVNEIKPLWPETELKFEYGNENFNTGVMPVRGSRVTDTYLEILLFEEKADCKAKDVCRTEEKSSVKTESCCEPSCCN